MTELTDQIGKYQAPARAGILDGGSARPPTQAELAQPIVAPGEPALLPIGIVYQANWQKLNDGIARHARAQVRALSQAGLPVCLRTIATGRMARDDELDPEVLDEIGHLRNVSLSETAIAIRQTILHSPGQLHNLICPPGGRLAGFALEKSVYDATIVYTSWERSTIDKALVEILERCGQVWVPCQRNADVFVANGVPEEKVHVVPQPYEPDRHLPSHIPAPRGRREVPDGRRFYAIGKWEPRKNYHTLLGAFLRAFRPNDRVSLMIKTHGWGQWKDYPDVRESMAHWLQSRVVRDNLWTPEVVQKRVRIVTKKLSDADMSRIHQQNNIYVSPSHGEAWELGAFDALCAGNSLVHVGWGGSEDYASSTRGLGARHMNACVVRVTDGAPALEDVPAEYGWEHGAQWATCGVDELASALAVAQPPTRRVHPPAFYQQYGAPAVGARMRSLVMQLARSLNPTLPQRLSEAGSFG